MVTNVTQRKFSRARCFSWVSVKRRPTWNLKTFLIGIFAASAFAGAAEVPTAWQRLDDGDPAAGYAVVVYDDIRNQVVRMNSAGGSRPPMLWEHDGVEWTRRSFPEPSPWNIGGACGAFDSDRGVVVTYGGTDSNETWEYDGVTWVRKNTASDPGNRSNCAMAYDRSTQRMVMFGGYDPFLIGVGGTWEYDGTDWTLITPRTSPSPRGDAGFTYITSDQKLLLYGGRDNTLLMGGTWEYDGARKNWTAKSPKHSPSFLSGAGLAYDPVRDVAVLFGGYGGYFMSDETWEWDGRDWTQVLTASAPSPRDVMRLYFNTQAGKIQAHGGNNEGYFDETWEYDGSAWTKLPDDPVPGNRSSFGLIYDPRFDHVVLYGGSAEGESPYWDDTWHFKSGAWELQEAAGVPTAFRGVDFHYDPHNDRIVGFSGATGNLNPPSDIHEYDGSVPGWLSIPTAGPDPRSQHSWTPAPGGNGGFVLNAGRACCNQDGNLYNATDTWILNGDTWTEIFPTTSPGKRNTPATAYMESIDRVVFYGGNKAPGGPQADTWLFDGQEWTLLDVSSPPGRLMYPAMAYDPKREVVVMVGTNDYFDTTTWEFDGSTWTPRNTPFMPDPERLATALVWDETKEVIFLFGGEGNGTSLLFNDTWVYGEDPDLDGIVGLLDNCVQDANADQLNADGDPAGDACDCAQGDPGSFAAPGPVTGLVLVGDDLSWDDQAPSVGDDVTYDLVTGAVADLVVDGGFSRAACLAQGRISPSYTDTRLPLSGEGFYYLARGRNVCGTGSYGTEHAGLDAADPCP